MNDRLHKVQPRSTYIITLTAVGNHKAIVGPFTRVEKDRVVDALPGGIGYSVEQITTVIPEWASNLRPKDTPMPGRDMTDVEIADLLRRKDEDSRFWNDEDESVNEGCPHCGRVLGVSNGLPTCDNCGWRALNEVLGVMTDAEIAEYANDEYVDEDIFRGER